MLLSKAPASHEVADPFHPLGDHPGEPEMTMIDTAHAFFEACETGLGWDGCKPWCHADATFSCQADALADTTTLAAYADWMKGLLGPIPDGRYELKAFAADEDRNTVVAAAVFHGTNTAPGPVPPTGKVVASDYVYVMQTDGGKIRHMTKVWNDGYALRALGWA
jgi:ketosteroid isomerase-like protein